MDAVLNWLWQGAALALATAALLRITRASTARARYLTLWVALAAVLALPAVPLLWAMAATVPLAPVLPPVDAVVSVQPGWWTSTTVLIAGWAAWAAVQAIRLGCGALALRSVRRRTRQLPPETESRLRHWMDIRARGRCCRLVVSDDVRCAAVLGCGSPVIALAPSALQQLGADELDAVVVHEWAHVQRRDDLVNALQQGIRMVAGWHPAVWWLDRQLQLERELACDEIVVRVTGSAKEFAACLARLAEVPRPLFRTMPALAVSSSGLRRRILRLLSLHNPARTRAARWTPALLCVAVSGLAAAVGGVRLIERATSVPLLEAAVRTIPWSALHASASQEPGPTGPAPARPTSDGGLPASSRDLSTPDRAREDMVSERNEAVLPFPASMHALTPLAADDSPREAVHAMPTVSPAVWNPMTTVTPRSPDVSDTAAAPLAGEAPATPWAAAADGGVAVARGSQKAAVVTAGFFGRLGKKLAGAF